MYSSAGSTVIIGCISFFLGCLLINFIVDHATLWTLHPTQVAFDIAERHYLNFTAIPHIVLGTGWFVFVMAVLGHIVKLHRGNQSNTLFDGASLVLLLIAFVLSANLQKSIKALQREEFETLSKSESIRVIAASNVIIGAALMGCIMLQIGQGHAERAAEVEIDIQKKKR